MKNIRYIVLLLMASLALSLNARDFVKGERIYVQPLQSDAIGDWGKDGANLFLYLFGGSSGESWIKLNLHVGGVYAGTFTTNCNYSKVIVVRKATSTSGWDSNVWNQTCDLTIPESKECNLINQFWAKNGDCGENPYSEWKVYAPHTEIISGYTSELTAEEIHICPTTLGDPYALKVKLNSAHTAYLHDDVYAHAWYSSTTGTTWTSVDGFSGKTRSQEFNKDTLVYLPTTLSSEALYYYLHSNNPAGRRLIKITTDGGGCDLDCSITSFETAISAVNADDNTYTLDGMVAFGEPNGNLVIECDGESTTITSPKSPQSFSLHGVPAATTDGTTTTATAYFTGNSGCTQTITLHVPNAKQALEVVQKEILTGETATLTPADADPDNDYIWIVNGDTLKKEDGQTQNFSVPAFTASGEQTYTYKEFYPISGTMNDMMSNGSYEYTTGYGTYGSVSTISDYNFWGYFNQTNYNFYADTLAGGTNILKLKDNGFAVVENAHNFAPSFATVTPRNGSNFALFDAKTGADGGNKKAWYATTANNPNLKLKKGTTYVLSFWAANINNYGEMDNAARFKFRIEYNGKTWESRVLDLGSDEFRNNIWHQCSQTFYAEEDCENVTISVVNLNTNTLNIGNDFALDDIQFHAISSISRVVKSQQKFVVNAHEPKVDEFTATPQVLACDATGGYTVHIKVDYQNPKGQLVIKDKTTGTEYPYDLPSVAFDTPATLEENITIASFTPETHEWEAYFSEWTSAQKTAVTVAPGLPHVEEPSSYQFSAPDCEEEFTTLTFDLSFTFQQGDFTYWVDDITPKRSADYTQASKTEQTLSALTFENIPADGKDNHVLHVEFSEANSCRKEFNLPAVPLSPKMTIAVTDLPSSVGCDDTNYSLNVQITTPYDATGKTIVVQYDDKDGAKETSAAATGTTTTIPLSLQIFDATGLSVKAHYDDASSCSFSATFDAPTAPVCLQIDTAICAGESYTGHGFEIITPAVGEYEYTSGFNTLHLTVKAVPEIAVGTISMICDAEADIRIPYSVTSGTPNEFTVAVNGTEYSATEESGEIVLPMPADIDAGSYTIAITTGETGVDCSSETSALLTIAMSERMLRKWEDVLFINNSDHRFVAYQWYENGVEMPGETQQRLFRPEGMPGTYFCRMTTTDGQEIYTCEETFEDVTRSRDLSNGNGAPERIISTYIVSPHITIIRVQAGDEIETRKILKYE